MPELITHRDRVRATVARSKADAAYAAEVARVARDRACGLVNEPDAQRAPTPGELARCYSGTTHC